MPGQAGKSKKTSAFFIIIFIFVDQLLKFSFIKFKVLPIYYNQGVSFSFLPSKIWLVVNLLVLSALFHFLLKKPFLGLVLIFAGGLSNFIDRILSDGVVDYIRMPLFPWAFNLGDLSIVLGAILLLRLVINEKNPKPKNHL